MEIPNGSQNSAYVKPNFEIPVFDSSTNCVVKIQSATYDADIELNYQGRAGVLSSESEYLPDDFQGYLSLIAERGNTGRYAMTSRGSVTQNYTIKVLSIDHNGQQIFP